MGLKIYTLAKKSYPVKSLFHRKPKSEPPFPVVFFLQKLSSLLVNAKPANQLVAWKKSLLKASARGERGRERSLKDTVPIGVPKRWRWKKEKSWSRFQKKAQQKPWQHIPLHTWNEHDSAEQGIKNKNSFRFP